MSAKMHRRVCPSVDGERQNFHQATQGHSPSHTPPGHDATNPQVTALSSDPSGALGGGPPLKFHETRDNLTKYLEVLCT